MLKEPGVSILCLVNVCLCQVSKQDYLYYFVRFMTAVEKEESGEYAQRKLFNCHAKACAG